MSKEIGKPINVSLKIIADLSQGIYRSPADALKELVNNAYDADSPEVNIDFAKDFSSVIIRDQGEGMTINNFIETMETIGGSSKRITGAPDTTPSGRKIIGRIGIGLLSVSQIASKLEIESTTKGSNIGFRSTIEFDQFASEEARKIKITDLWEKGKTIRIGNYYYTEINGVEKSLHFTTLKLIGLKRSISGKLDSESEKDGQHRMLGKKLSTAKELFQWIAENGITKVALHDYDRIFWELCTLCPVPYLDNCLKVHHNIKSSSTTEEFKAFAQEINNETHFVLKVDGVQCFKPILIPSTRDRSYPLFFNLLFMQGLNNQQVSYKDYDKNGTLVEKKLNLRGYLYFQRPKIWPPELQGIIIRVRHVGVGQYDSTFMTYRKHEGFKFSQVTGEILIDDLDNTLNIDRSSFRETDASFVALRDAIHGYLQKTVFPWIKDYANVERQERGKKELHSNTRLLQSKFKLADTDKRTIVFSDNQLQLVTRSGSEVSLARSVNGEKIKFSIEVYRIIAFLEAYLSEKLSTKERDKLFKELIEWLEKFK